MTGVFMGKTERWVHVVLPPAHYTHMRKIVWYTKYKYLPQVEANVT